MLSFLTAAYTLHLLGSLQLQEDLNSNMESTDRKQAAWAALFIQQGKHKVLFRATFPLRQKGNASFANAYNSPMSKQFKKGSKAPICSSEVVNLLDDIG